MMDQDGAKESLDFVMAFVNDLRDQHALGVENEMGAPLYDPNYAEDIEKWGTVLYHLSWHYYNLEGK